MDREADLLEFALVWRHWGGGSDADIFVEFGISPGEYFSRLRALIDRGALAWQPTGIVHQIREICQRRIARERSLSSAKRQLGTS
ncbi:DUF3263 domain-containing protein [Nocardia abscessus]|uniref:DUF3263 domain-containing protein n=1 Tax=Nocardia abscessus TaxID=120957 RepID=UPI002458DFB9|nr:DUF3263 domain-containing protein [Nocardia abscessus]